MSLMRSQDEMQALEKGERGLDVYHDDDAPGGGRFYCPPCARHFTTEGVLAEHCRSKPHKRMVKLASEPQYTQKEADAGAGMSTGS